MASTPGFQGNFYGFFVYAALWVGFYLVLVRYLNRRDR
jgi:hypothetical protein